MRPITMFVTGGAILLKAGETPDNVARKIGSLAVAWAKAGVSVVQIREPWMTDRNLLELVRLVVSRVSAFDTKIVVNDRADIAVAADAHGIHLKDEPLDVVRIREYGSKDWLISRSVHDVETAKEICGGGHVDYLVAGTVKTSATKADKRFIGFGGLQEIASAVSTPVLAIGGLEFSDSADVQRAAGTGLAGIRLFMNGDRLTDEERSHQIDECRQVFGPIKRI